MLLQITQLTTYKILPTSKNDGFVEMVPNCKSLRVIINESSGDLQGYLRKLNPNPTGPFGMEPNVLSNFVRSCAGYCAITYVLCIGDRHLDNLLLTKDGHLFHIDFGMIGREPPTKIRSPPIKLSIEMVQLMGGQQSPHFVLFNQLCVEAYNILRKNANLILNLVYLMSNSSVEDLANERTRLQMQERFQLHLSDEEAGKSLQKVLQDCVTALFGRLNETLHAIKYNIFE